MKKVKVVVLNPFVWILIICTGLEFWKDNNPLVLDYMQSHSLNVPMLVFDGQYYRLMTSLFLHKDPGHLIGNMVSLAILSWLVWKLVSKKQYLVILLVSGVIGNLLADIFVTYLFHLKENIWPIFTSDGYLTGIVGFSTAIAGLFIFTLITFFAVYWRHLKAVKGRLIVMVIFVVLTIGDVILGFQDSTGLTMTAYVHTGGGLVGGLFGIWYVKKERRQRLDRA
ncbi:rhomboid family intramembrane serine protease [Lacticaseibacillus chiayiensis]|uniref:rhomboid family intramembrane serine protease n=1 Tax=Lacticaseibacillus chiayiensis TaxID=2100821 RepID=UPI0010105E0B|nr:rhomboid family intramembrane serine protease [Lacticaseibacillus chiayiensis]RXT58487.1 hypothetical protein CHT97_05925 [Lacticaseibacillus chiayiensis]